MAGNVRDHMRRKRLSASIKLTVGCVDCGYAVDHRALEFDHVRGTKVRNVSMMGSWKAYWSEMDKCDVRCANCHTIRSYRGSL